MVRYQDGEIVVHTTGQRSRALVLSDPAVLVLLSRFATPNRAANAIASVSLDRATATRAIRLLLDVEALIACSDAEPGALRQQSDERERAHDYLKEIATTTYALAGDLLAFDRTAYENIATLSGAGVLDRLESVLGAMEALQHECTRIRKDFIRHQQAALRIAVVRGLKLNIGAGRFPLDSWINLGLPPAQLAMNLHWGLPFPNASASYVFMAHVLEHLYYPDEALAIVKEIRRVLRPGGRARIVVPDIEKWLNAYVNGNNRFFKARRNTWRSASRGTRMEQLMLYCGAGEGAHPSYFFGHKFGYDFETLRTLLLRAGFKHIERSDFMRSRDATLRVDDRSAVAGAGFEGGHYSLFVEAG